MLLTPQKPMVFSTVHTPLANLVFDVNDRFKLGLSYIHSYFPVMMLISPGVRVVASRRSPSAKLRLQAIPMECELPVQPWPDSFGWAGYTNAKMEPH